MIVGIDLWLCEGDGMRAMHDKTTRIFVCAWISKGKDCATYDSRTRHPRGPAVTLLSILGRLRIVDQGVPHFHC